MPMSASASGGEREPRQAAAQQPRLRKIKQTTAVRGMFAKATAEPSRRSAGLFIGSKTDAGSTDLNAAVEGGWDGNGTPELERSLRVLLEQAVSRAEGADGEEVVGWYIVRSGSDGVAASDDLAIHGVLFPDWWQIALVIDPRSRCHGIYGWRDGRMQQLGGRTGPPNRKESAERHSPTDPKMPPAGGSRARGGRARDDDVTVRWSGRAALAVPLGAGLVGGVVLAVLR